MATRSAQALDFGTSVAEAYATDGATIELGLGMHEGAIGALSPATVGVLLRSLVRLEESGRNDFFGDPQLDIADLVRMAPDGRGIISGLEKRRI